MSESPNAAAAASAFSKQVEQPPVQTVEAQVCRLVTESQVCICSTCEATRTRMLHRSNKGTSLSSGKKRVREEEASAAALSVSSASDQAAATKNKLAQTQQTDKTKLATMSAACRTILECIGEDPDREGLQKTPERWAKALLFMCNGYDKQPEDVTNGAVFSENHDEMVVVRNIDIHSLCEHHMVRTCLRACLRLLLLSALARERVNKKTCHSKSPLVVLVSLSLTHFFIVCSALLLTFRSPLRDACILDTFPMAKFWAFPSWPALPNCTPDVYKSKNV